ncbi:hypothetical protein M3172_25105 [Mesobacillus subterraneus]|uniref:hypothetical protein n=1 Tax=Mesobacillus subterraneus TaxID=285983 RepID=UPI002041DEA0|nr:hypothetical protein [Mesobacillus subterraneus]MCM3576431.1 hypothetical protein [Mesobacillus subterraneus]
MKFLHPILIQFAIFLVVILVFAKTPSFWHSVAFIGSVAAVYLLMINVFLNERFSRTLRNGMIVVLSIIIVGIMNLFTNVNVTWLMGLIIVGTAIIGIVLTEIARKIINNKRKNVP